MGMCLDVTGFMNDNINARKDLAAMIILHWMLNQMHGGN
jgi:hypothetical protein